MVSRFDTVISLDSDDAMIAKPCRVGDLRFNISSDPTSSGEIDNNRQRLLRFSVRPQQIQIHVTLHILSMLLYTHYLLCPLVELTNYVMANRQLLQLLILQQLELLIFFGIQTILQI